MPANGKTTSWTYTDIAGDFVKCNANLTTINYNGEERKAIRVEKTYTDSSAIIIDYYVYGVGFWKEECKTDNETLNFDILDELIFDKQVEI